MPNFIKRMKMDSNWIVTDSDGSNLNVVCSSKETESDENENEEDSKKEDGKELKLNRKRVLQNVEESTKMDDEDSDGDDGKADVVEEEVSDAESLDVDSDVEEQPQTKSLCRKTNFKLFKMENSDKYVVLLKCGQIFTFQGKLRVTLLSGDVQVCGYRVNNASENKTMDIYSPRRCMQLVVKSLPSASQANLSQIREMLSDKLSATDLDQLIGDHKPHDSVLLIGRLLSVYSPVFQHYCDEIDIFYEKQIMQDESSVAKHLGCLLDGANSSERRLFNEGYDWKRIKLNKCSVLCGGKGVGKSTLLKYLINAQLLHQQSILYLDFDPGQSEFTAPGCVSAVVVREPLFGPNFTHIIKPERMAFLGFVNVALNPIRYMKSINYIIEACRQDPELVKLPWLVNTMGFNKGIGLDIMVNIIRILQPDTVIQISSSDVSKNYEIFLEPQSVKTHPVISFLNQETTDLNYTFYSINACAKNKGMVYQSGFKPVELRNLMFLSYFSELVTFPYYSLNAAQPYWLPLSDVTFAVPESIQPNYVLKAFNGSTVGLCNLDGVECEAKMEAEDEGVSALKIAIKPDISPCFGLGIVRGFDCTENKVYVLTTLTGPDLEKVDCLCLGNVSPPPCLFLKQRYLDEPALYTDICETKNVQTMKKTFKYMGGRTSQKYS